MEPVAEEVEMTVCQVHVHRAGFVGMQCESGPGHPFPELFQRGFGFFFSMAEDDHVIGIPHHIKTKTGHQPVQRIEADVARDAL